MNHRWLAVPSASRVASWLLTLIALLGRFGFGFVDWRVAGRLGSVASGGCPRVIALIDLSQAGITHLQRLQRQSLVRQSAH